MTRSRPTTTAATRQPAGSPAWAGRPRAAHRAGRAFSLLELLAVVMLLSLVTALVAPSIGAASVRDRERSAIADLTRALRLERIEAVRSMRTRRVDLRVEDGTVALESSFARGEPLERTRPLGPFGVAPLEWDGRERTIVFEADGRTASPPISWAGAPGSDRVWIVSFDPLSGEPVGRLRDAGDGRPAQTGRGR